MKDSIKEKYSAKSPVTKLKTALADLAVALADNEKLTAALKIASEEYNKIHAKNLQLNDLLAEVSARKVVHTEKTIIVRDTKQYCTHENNGVNCNELATYKMELKTSTVYFCSAHAIEKSIQYAKEFKHNRVSPL